MTDLPLSLIPRIPKSLVPFSLNNSRKIWLKGLRASMSFKVAYISMQMMSQMKYFRPWSMQWWDEERTVGPAKCNAVALSESKWKRRIFWTFRWEWSRWRRSGSRVPVEESQTVAMQAMVTALRKAPTTIVEKGMLIPPWLSLPCTSK